ncbi:MAG: hypothetical protein ACRESZ_20710, partial [Methylococcales bacterium]
MQHHCKYLLGIGVLFVCLALGFGLVAPAYGAQPVIQPSALHQIQVLKQMKTSRSKVQQKLDSRLHLALQHKRGDARLRALPDFRFQRPDADGLIAVDISLYTAAGVKSVVDYLETLDAKILGMNYRYQTIRARVRLDDLENIAGLEAVRRVQNAVPAMTHKINTSQGDATHGADIARGFFGSNGTGVKVCVMSDGVDSLASLQASGDLPPFVDVLPGQAGSGDEGSAMLEIVHDLA